MTLNRFAAMLRLAALVEIFLAIDHGIFCRCGSLTVAVCECHKRNSNKKHEHLCFPLLFLFT